MDIESVSSELDVVFAKYSVCFSGLEAPGVDYCVCYYITSSSHWHRNSVCACVLCGVVQRDREWVKW